MNDNINPNPDASISARKDTITMDRSFILTQGKNLVTGMPYLYNEGNKSVVVRLLETWTDYEMEDEFVHLTLQELQTNRTFTISWNLNYQGSYYLWTLADLPTLMTMTK